HGLVVRVLLTRADPAADAAAVGLGGHRPVVHPLHLLGLPTEQIAVEGAQGATVLADDLEPDHRGAGALAVALHVAGPQADDVAGPGRPAWRWAASAPSSCSTITWTKRVGSRCSRRDTYTRVPASSLVTSSTKSRMTSSQRASDSGRTAKAAVLAIAMAISSDRRRPRPTGRARHRRPRPPRPAARGSGPI